MKVGILGGTFNPIHQGHINIAEHAKRSLGLDKILLIPTNIPPHKSNEGVVDGVDRYNMCKLAARGIDYIQVSDIELKKEGPSRTIDTLQYLSETYPFDKFFLIMGSDMFLTFRQWYKYREIANLSTLCVFPRYFDENWGNILVQTEYLKKEIGVHINIQDTPVLEISSTQVRESLSKNLDTAVYLHKDVLKYINAVLLYTDKKDRQIEYYKKKVRAVLSDKRYIHSINVAKEAVRLGIIYGTNLNKAYISGILHDIFKENNDPNALQNLWNSGIICKEKYKNNKPLWHSVLGAEYVRLELGVEDTDVINAIRYHTSGRAGMSDVEEVVFLADKISLDRDYPDLEKVRNIADISMAYGMLYVLSFSLQTLISNEENICNDTVWAYNYYLEQSGNNN